MDLKASTRALSVQVLRVMKQRYSAAISTDEVVEQILREHHGDANKQERAKISQRIRDVLHVLEACGMVTKNATSKKLVPRSNHPLLLPPTTAAEESSGTLEQQQQQMAELIAEKRALLGNLLQQHILLHELVQRNKTLAGEDASHNRLALPFLVVQSTSTAPVEVTISQDRCRVVAQFDASNNASFDVTDDISVLLSLGLLEDVSEATIRTLVPEALLDLLPPVLKSKLSSSSSSDADAPEAKRARLEDD